MATRCNIAVLLEPQDLKVAPRTFDKRLIPFVYRENPYWKTFCKTPTFENVPYRPVDLSGIPLGKVVRILCRFDGEVRDGVGEELLKAYGTKEKALNLVLGGHLENLASFMRDGKVRFGYENWAMSGRDRGQGRYVPQDRLFVVEDPDKTALDGAYMYLFKDGRWLVHNVNDTKDIPFWTPVAQYEEPGKRDGHATAGATADATHN